jgi:hypothetical protein
MLSLLKNYRISQLNSIIVRSISRNKNLSINTHIICLINHSKHIKKLTKSAAKRFNFLKQNLIKLSA